MDVQLFAWLGLLLTLSAGTWGLFAYFEDTSRQEIKDKISSWLTGITPIHLSARWPSTFVQIFDGLFGNRKFSFRFGLISAVSSIVIVAILLCAWWITHPQEVLSYFSQHWFYSVLILFVFSVANIVPDYLSNCQSRYIMGKMSHSAANLRSYAGWLVLDFFLTVTFSLLIVVPLSFWTNDYIIFLTSGLFATSPNADTFDIAKFLTLHSTKIFSRHDDMTGGYRVSMSPPYGLFFYTTFLTSTWLWIYSLCGTLVAIVHRLFGRDAAIFKWFDFEKHPLKSLGGICAMFVTFLYISVTLLLALFRC